MCTSRGVLNSAAAAATAAAENVRIRVYFDGGVVGGVGGVFFDGATGVVVGNCNGGDDGDKWFPIVVRRLTVQGHHQVQKRRDRALGAVEVAQSLSLLFRCVMWQPRFTRLLCLQPLRSCRKGKSAASVPHLLEKIYQIQADH